MRELIVVVLVFGFLWCLLKAAYFTVMDLDQLVQYLVVGLCCITGAVRLKLNQK